MKSGIGLPEREVVRLLERALEDTAAVAELYSLVDKARGDGDIECEHRLADATALVELFHRTNLEMALGMMRRTCGVMPDRLHYLLLSAILRALGDSSGAADAEVEAARHPNLHSEEALWAFEVMNFKTSLS